MELTGGCYCGELRYKADGEAAFRGQCHCRECQYLSGGGPNMALGMLEEGFEYTRGQPRQFQRKDIENGVIRDFCGNCGTQILTRTGAMPGVVILKVGTLDDPKIFGQPDMAIFTVDKQAFHVLPEGLPAFERLPEGM